MKIKNRSSFVVFIYLVSDLTLMKCVFIFSCFFIEILSIHFCYLLRSVLCCDFFDNSLSENLLDFVPDNKAENMYIMSDKNSFDYTDLTLFYSEFNFPVLAFEHSCLPNEDYVKGKDVAEKEDINIFYDKQSELINKMMIFFSENREYCELKDLNELLDLKLLLEKFLSNTITIRSKMLYSLKKHLTIHDKNMNLTLKSMKYVKKIKLEIKNVLKRKKSDLLKFACFKREIKPIKKFNSEVNATYQYCKIKRIKILEDISNFKELFNAAIDLIKSISNLFEFETFTNVKETLLIVFNMFDKNKKDSIYEMDDLIKGMIAISLRKIYDINNSVHLLADRNY